MLGFVAIRLASRSKVLFVDLEKQPTGLPMKSKSHLLFHQRVVEVEALDASIPDLRQFANKQVNLEGEP